MNTYRLPNFVHPCLWLFFLLCTHIEAATENSDDSAEIIRRIKGEYGEIIVKLRSRRFEPQQHSIEQKHGATYVDGVRVIGTDGSIPFREFSKFEILWNRKAVPLEREFYASICNARLNDGEKCVGVAISDRRDAVLISITCGDATRTRVHLVIRKDGSWHRFEKDYGED